MSDTIEQIARDLCDLEAAEAEAWGFDEALYTDWKDANAARRQRFITEAHKFVARAEVMP